jgi:hypothetical protein
MTDEFREEADCEFAGEHVYLHVRLSPITVNVVHSADDVLVAIQSLKEDIAKMAVNTDLLAAAETAESAAINNAIAQLPSMVGAAVAKALADAGVSNATVQAAVDAATAQATTDTTNLLSAFPAPAPTP